jgi:hypothetical protein
METSETNESKKANRSTSQRSRKSAWGGLTGGRPSRQRTNERTIARWAADFRPQLPEHFARAVTAAAMMHGSVTYESIADENIVPVCNITGAIDAAFDRSWLHVNSEGRFEPLTPPQDLAIHVDLIEQSGGTVGDFVADTCFDMVINAMRENGARDFSERDARLGRCGPCTSRTWHLIEPMLVEHPEIDVMRLSSTVPHSLCTDTDDDDFDIDIERAREMCSDSEGGELNEY